ncbi:MAG TPA: hypothetical protein DEF45_10460 [Rhodopirellula sp.]|nr:hypothetical protein [Rhodopirellula sp.]
MARLLSGSKRVTPSSPGNA